MHIPYSGIAGRCLYLIPNRSLHILVYDYQVILNHVIKLLEYVDTLLSCLIMAHRFWSPKKISKDKITVILYGPTISGH